MKAYEGIDLSRHNRVDSWQLVKSSGVDFVILRAGGHDKNSFYKDSKFEAYYNACKMYDIPVGAYFDCGKRFYTAEFGIECAQHFKKLLSGKQFEMPVYMDIEITPRAYKTLITEAAISFCREMEEAEYYVGIYASDISGFKELLDASRIQNFDKWVARYGAKPSYVKSYGMWQYTSGGHIDGIFGNVDRDITTKDYPYIIKRGHFNGY